MPFTPTEKIWHNGKLIPWDQAQIHVTSHVVNYGSAVFEGVRCYKTPSGPAIFRLKEHTDRLYGSAKVYRMEIPFTRQQIMDAMGELVRANGLPQCYLRPIVLRGYGQVGVDPSGSPIEVFIACWEWGKYLGPEAQERGVDVCVSSWLRPAPNTLPAMAKAAGNYLSSQLVKMEAVANGYTEGICLDVEGFVGEGSGENIFLVRDGVLWTPPLSASILPGITRDSVIKLAGDLDIKVMEQSIPREALYLADEVFFCGTAVEITPIRSVDRVTIGEGRRGPITRALQEDFFAILEGRREDRYGWLTPVGVEDSAPAPAPALK